MKFKQLTLEDFDCHAKTKSPFDMPLIPKILRNEEKVVGFLIGLHVSTGIFLIFAFLI